MPAFERTSTVIAWFTLYQDYGFLGLLDSFLLDVVAVVLMIPVFLALYVALKRAGESFMAIATGVMFVGITLFLAVNGTLSMFYLSNQYAAATTDAQRSLFITTGQAMLELGQHGTGGAMAILLQSVAGLMISIVM
jgi:hypothetical protein